MTITAKVIADSISPQDIRLTTMQLRYPKFIHGEFMTHRVFSRNASSSRAIPITRLIQDVLDDPAMPVFWGKHQPGMQATEELDPIFDRPLAIVGWLNARDEAVQKARALAKLGVHKQIVNRVIEPWCHINVVVTATEWSNFFVLRRHAAAQPEMKALADAMWEAREASIPRLLQPGEWHLPYVDPDEIVPPERGVFDERPRYFSVSEWEKLAKLSVARCARVSYLTHEGKPPNIEEDLKLYDRLVGSVPLHASPAEHQATPDMRQSDIDKFMSNEWCNPEQHANFIGWRQYRKMLPGESL
jgi:hypothetical protein